MPYYDGRNRRLIFKSGERISRRLFLQLAAGVAGGMISSSLVACRGATEAPGPTVVATPPPGGVAPSPILTSTAEAQPKRGGILRIGYPEPSSLDPQYIVGVLEGNLVGLIYDALMTQDPNTREYIVGPACESFEISQDQLTWTFRLKRGIVFHDGTPFTAQVVKENYEHAVDPEAATYVTGVYLPPNPTFEAPDDYTFSISSPEPYGPMASHLFWDAWFGIYSPPARKKYGADFGRNPVGFGPFKFREWVAGDHLILDRFEKYTWGEVFLNNKGPAYLDQLFIKFINDPSTLIAALQSGDIDMAFLPNQFYEEFAADPNFQILTRPSGRLVALAWNHERWPYNDLKTRQALLHGFDRERFLKVMEEGHGQVMYGVIVPALPHYWKGEQDVGPRYDLDKAKALLAEAGWADTDGDGIIEKDGKPFRSVFITPGTEDGTRFASLVQDQARQLGIDVRIEALEQATYSARLRSGDFDLFRFIYDTVDPDILAFFFHSSQIPKEGGSGFNYSRVNDPRLDALIDRQRHTLFEERDKAVEEAVRYMMEHATCLPLYCPEKHTAVRKKVRGVIFMPNAMDWNLTEAWIEG